MTALTSTEKQHIRASFKRIAPNAEHIINLLYENLFSAYPNLRPLFDTANIKDQQAKMLRTLMASVAFLDDIETLKTEMRSLGQRHFTYGVAARHYDALGDVLVETLQHNTVAPITEAEAAAWRKLYDMMAQAARNETQIS